MKLSSWRFKVLLAITLLVLTLSMHMPSRAEVRISGKAKQIPNELIDSAGFLRDVKDSQELREDRRVTEDEFIEKSKDANTIILDARTEGRFKMMHIVGAKNLSFTEFTEDNLKSVIPNKNTAILIYCNNNIANSPEAFATKSFTAALNLSTYTSLYSYGYRNDYELGPVIDPKSSKIKFEGSRLSAANRL